MDLATVKEEEEAGDVGGIVAPPRTAAMGRDGGAIRNARRFSSKQSALMGVPSKARALAGSPHHREVPRKPLPTRPVISEERPMLDRAGHRGDRASSAPPTIDSPTACSSSSSSNRMHTKQSSSAAVHRDGAVAAPPSNRLRPNSRILDISVDIGKGEKREIRVFAHDTHLTLAQNFVHEHGLAPGMARKLSNHISALVNTHAAESASPKNRSTRVLDISIGIGDGRKEAIHVHAGDIHHTLACQFVKQHGLAVDMVPKLTDHITKLVLAHAREVHTAAAPILGVPPSSAVREFDQTVDGAPPPPPAKVGAALTSGGQHALRDSDAFDELLANGFVVETKEEGSGKKRRPRKGDVVQVTVETYVSLVLCVCMCVSVCACVRVCVCVDCSRSASRSPSLLSTLNPPSGVGPQYETVHESGINASRQGRGWKVSW